MSTGWNYVKQLVVIHLRVTAAQSDSVLLLPDACSSPEVHFSTAQHPSMEHGSVSPVKTGQCLDVESRREDVQHGW